MMRSLVAPIALRNPISLVRSETVTSMMFITPIPPSDNVIAAISPRNSVIASNTAAVRCMSSTVSHIRIALVSAGSKSCARATTRVTCACAA